MDSDIDLESAHSDSSGSSGSSKDVPMTDAAHHSPTMVSPHHAHPISNANHAIPVPASATAADQGHAAVAPRSKPSSRRNDDDNDDDEDGGDDDDDDDDEDHDDNDEAEDDANEPTLAQDDDDIDHRFDEDPDDDIDDDDASESEPDHDDPNDASWPEPSSSRHSTTTTTNDTSTASRAAPPTASTPSNTITLSLKPAAASSSNGTGNSGIRIKVVNIPTAPQKTLAQPPAPPSKNQSSRPLFKQTSKSGSRQHQSHHRKRIKVVPFDPVHIPVGEKASGYEKLISYRVNEQGAEKILIKYRGMSYYHAEWVARHLVESERNGKNRVKKFLDKPSWDHYSDDEPFNPAFLKIDRIIDVGEHEDTLMYLVKWCNQPYESATWETQAVVEELDPDKVEEYGLRNIISPEKQTSYGLAGRRQPTKRWVKLDESPVFKSENSLRSYQLEGLNWLMFCWYNQQNSILADEMGLGKTVQSTAFLNMLYHQENIRGPFLIVTPLSTIGNWEREIRGWTDMNAVVYHGSQVSRNLIIETEFYHRDESGNIIPDYLKVDIVLTSYEMAMSGASQLRPIPWRAVVLDEAHRLKNRTSKVSEILKTYTMEHRVLLTGTPLQNSLDELWALLNFLEPTKFASEQAFKTNYGFLNTAADVERLQALLKPLMLRRLKEDVEKSIPVKEETIVEVELTTTQKKWYRSILEKNFSWLKQGTGKRSNVPNLINTMIELRKCCIHPWLLKGAEDQIVEELGVHSPEQHFQALIQSSGKMVLIDKLLKKLKQGGHKVLIFSQMTRCLDLIQDYLRCRGWLYERIDGGVRSDLRQASIDRFSAPGSESFVFLLCTRAGGVGINLTAADTCIIFDSDWNPQNDLQAQSRAHRIGQKKTVQIYRLITRNTYEREMFDRASLKLGLDRAILQRMNAQDGGNGNFTGFDVSSSKHAKLTTEEIEELLKKGAYGAFMDDEASKQFCEEDIDQILERRTQVIRHNAPGTSTSATENGDKQEPERGSMFSVATFQAAGSAAEIDVDDPDFWDKVAKQAEFKLVEEEPEEGLILDVPRNRRQVNRFGIGRGDEEDGDSGTPGTASGAHGVDQDQQADASYGVATTLTTAAQRAKEEPKLWSLTERTRLERILMQHGYNNWGKAREAFPRRSVYDLQAVSRVLLKCCILSNPAGVEPDVMKDVKRALACFPAYTERPEGDLPRPEDLERRTHELNHLGEEVEPDDSVLDAPAELLPYPWATPRERTEYESFPDHTNTEYMDYISRKAKNILIRVALLFNIRNKCNPTLDMYIPKFLGSPPAAWWGDLEDNHLMVGICRHGYQQKYTKVWEDPELCFREHFRYANQIGAVIVSAMPGKNPASFHTSLEEDGGVGAAGTDEKTGDEGDVKDEDMVADTMDSSDLVKKKEDNGVVKMEDVSTAIVSDAVAAVDDGGNEDVADAGEDDDGVKMEAADAGDDAPDGSSLAMQQASDAVVAFDTGAVADLDNEPPAVATTPLMRALRPGQKFVIPSATDLGVRVRRIINAMSRHRQTIVRERLKQEAAESRKRNADAIRAKKQKLREKDFSKRQRHDFQRVLTAWGLPRRRDVEGSGGGAVPPHPLATASDEPMGNTPQPVQLPPNVDWEGFKRYAELDKKSDEAMGHYYLKVMRLAREVIALNEGARRALSGTPVLDDGDDDGGAGASGSPAVVGVKIAPSDGAAVSAAHATTATGRTSAESATMGAGATVAKNGRLSVIGADDAASTNSLTPSRPSASTAASTPAEIKSSVETPPKHTKSKMILDAGPATDPIEPDNDGDGDQDNDDDDDEAAGVTDAARRSGKIIVDTDGEVLTLEKAKKIVKRVDMFERLRSGVLEDPLIERKLQAVKRHGKSSMPKWWDYPLDRYLLIAIDRYGVLRVDDMIQDQTLPFAALREEYERSLEYRKQNNVPAEELVWGKFDEKFWPREAIIVRRFEVLVNYACRPLSKKSQRAAEKAEGLLSSSGHGAGDESMQAGGYTSDADGDSTFVSAAFGGGKPGGSSAATPGGANRIRPRTPSGTPDAHGANAGGAPNSATNSNGNKMFRLKLRLNSSGPAGGASIVGGDSGRDAVLSPSSAAMAMSKMSSAAGSAHSTPGSSYGASGALGLAPTASGMGHTTPTLKIRGSRSKASDVKGAHKSMSKTGKSSVDSTAVKSSSHRDYGRDRASHRHGDMHDGDDGDSSGGDTDDMLEAASRRLQGSSGGSSSAAAVGLSTSALAAMYASGLSGSGAGSSHSPLIAVSSASAASSSSSSSSAHKKKRRHTDLDPGDILASMRQSDRDRRSADASTIAALAAAGAASISKKSKKHKDKSREHDRHHYRHHGHEQPHSPKLPKHQHVGQSAPQAAQHHEVTHGPPQHEQHYPAPPPQHQHHQSYPEPMQPMYAPTLFPGYPPDTKVAVDMSLADRIDMTDPNATVARMYIYPSQHQHQYPHPHPHTYVQQAPHPYPQHYGDSAFAGHHYPPLQAYAHPPPPHYDAMQAYPVFHHVSQQQSAPQASAQQPQPPHYYQQQPGVQNGHGVGTPAGEPPAQHYPQPQYHYQAPPMNITSPNAPDDPATATITATATTAPTATTTSTLKRQHSPNAYSATTAPHTETASAARPPADDAAHKRARISDEP